MNLKTAGRVDANAHWWRGAVIYQIYPRSYQDGNDDGIGDLPGITKRLAYVSQLGADAVWISPFFVSPMKDFGYDVADYCDIDPMFGSLADFAKLVEVAHSLGLRVMIDLVISHTSDQHPWFVQSRSDRDNDKSDWYVWADAKPDGTPPNNWLSIFGGTAWQWDTRRCQYYMHNFLASQPDLNFHNPQVRDAVLDVARFWLERGVDGFRLDTINFYFCDEQLRDNPPLAVERRNDSIAHAVNPYNFQDHLYDKNRPENVDFLRSFRALTEEFNAIATLGEVGDAQYGIDIVAQYTAGDDLVQMCYAFEFLSAQRLTAQRVEGVLRAFSKADATGWACWAFSNHDVVRHATRWALSKPAQKLFASLLLSLRGSVCLYQGEELGLPEAEVQYEDLQDPYGIAFWPEFKGRDGCRTPMVWNGDDINGGFTTSSPWLPVAAQHLPQAVAQQENVAESMLSHYKRMLAFRKHHKPLVSGELTELHCNGDVLSFRRHAGNEEMFCAFNIGDGLSSVSLPDGDWSAIDLHGLRNASDNTVQLSAWEYFYALRA